MTQSRVLQLEPTQVPEWDAEDLIEGRLAANWETADPDTAKRMLNRVRLELPDAVDHRELVRYARAHSTPLDENLDPDIEIYDFHLIELPLNILVPERGDERRRLVRLRVSAAIDADGGRSCAYDLFPRDQWENVKHDIGEASVDVTKALNFVFPAAADVLGLKLTVPLRWHTQSVGVRTSDRMSNPVEWYVTDETINHGFTAYTIVRVPKGSPFKVAVSVVCELRRKGLAAAFTKATFRSGAQEYSFAGT